MTDATNDCSAGQGCRTPSPGEVSVTNFKISSATPSPPNSQVEPETRVIRPALLRRRIAAGFIDLLLLDRLMWGFSILTGTELLSTILAATMFFAGWVWLTRRTGMSPGKWILQIIIIDDVAERDKTLFLLLRFTMTWLPLLALFLTTYDPTFIQSESTPLWYTALIVVVLLWYVISLLMLLLTRGKKNISDFACGTHVDLRFHRFLTWPRRIVALVLFIVMLILICLPLYDTAMGFFISQPQQPEDTEQLTSSTETDTAGGLPLEQLALTAQTVYGDFRETDFWDDDVLQWNGTASVLYEDEGKLYLVSNSHVLGLLDLAQSDDSTDGSPEVGAYMLTVVFANGIEKPVLRFADQAGTLDLSLLEVDASGLVAGRDYIPLPFDAELQCHVGDEVVAVGSPRELAGTHTFGKISALRDFDDGEPCSWIQTDAAINPGNSGGPLFLKCINAFKWVGVNTLKSMTDDNLGFAIDAKHVWASQYYWYPASPEGAAQAINQNYRHQATVQ